MNEMRKAAEAKDMKALNEGVHHLRSSWMQIESRKQGFGEETDGGTLFLEEIGNLPTEVQQMLLRALESKMYRPMDGNRDKKADVCVTAATNEDLPTAIAEKRFRADLYQRLKEYALHIPPLRECKEDILPLADFFLRLANEEFEKQVKGFDAKARKRLLAYTWNGNVRELRRVVCLAVLHTESDIVTVETLEFDEVTLAGDVPWTLDGMEKKQILRAWEQATATARWLPNCSASDAPHYMVKCKSTVLGTRNRKLLPQV
ncbi:sigma 54-interacting transcriptional regulator [Parabacteroides johnsonii]|nr:sigma 54-interacting transcriptional regulator [Parabacteroides johnsonii]